MADAGTVLWWSIILIALLLAAFVAVAQVKKRFVQPDDPAGGGFTLADLRALHRQGKMNDQEFEKAKQVLFGSIRHVTERAAQVDGAIPVDPPEEPSTGEDA